MSISWKTGASAGSGQPARRLVITQGEYQVIDDPDTVISTVLGSCVAACIRDPRLGIGGMNHFVLPAPAGAEKPGSDPSRYGYYLMDRLVNTLLQRGASLNRLEAKVFGGASSLLVRSSVGARNVDYAVRFLNAVGIAIVEAKVGGSGGRKLEYWPVSGKATIANVQSSSEVGLGITGRRLAP